MPYAVSYDTTVSASVIGTRLHIPVVALTCVLMGVSFNCVSASVIGTRLHIPVALTCVLMGVYVLLLKWGWVLCQCQYFHPRHTSPFTGAMSTYMCLRHPPGNQLTKITDLKVKHLLWGVSVGNTKYQMTAVTLWNIQTSLRSLREPESSAVFCRCLN